MSTYDAYNLSLRDSTEFTVPAGGSGGDSDFSTATLTIDATDFHSFDSIFGAVSIAYVDENYGTIASWPTSDASSQVYHLTVILYAGKATITLNKYTMLSHFKSYSGAIAPTQQGTFEMTGDATVVLFEQSL